MGMSMGARPYAAIHHWHGCWVICGHPPWAWVLGHTRPSTMGMGAGPYAAILSRTVRHHHHHRHLGKPTLNQQEPPSPAPVMLQQQQHPGTTLTIMGSTPAAATPSWAAHLQLPHQDGQQNLQLPHHHGQHTCSCHTIMGSTPVVAAGVAAAAAPPPPPLLSILLSLDARRHVAPGTRHVALLGTRHVALQALGTWPS